MLSGTHADLADHTSCRASDPAKRVSTGSRPILRNQVELMAFRAVRTRTVPASNRGENRHFPFSPSSGQTVMFVTISAIAQRIRPMRLKTWLLAGTGLGMLAFTATPILAQDEF